MRGVGEAGKQAAGLEERDASHPQSAVCISTTRMSEDARERHTVSWTGSGLLDCYPKRAGYEVSEYERVLLAAAANRCIKDWNGGGWSNGRCERMNGRSVY